MKLKKAHVYQFLSAVGSSLVGAVVFSSFNVLGGLPEEAKRGLTGRTENVASAVDAVNEAFYWASLCAAVVAGLLLFASWAYMKHTRPASPPELKTAQPRLGYMMAGCAVLQAVAFTLFVFGCASQYLTPLTGVLIFAISLAIFLVGWMFIFRRLSPPAFRGTFQRDGKTARQLV